MGDYQNGITNYDIYHLMTVEQLNNSKIPIIVFDKKLEQFRGKTLFPEKLAKANEILAKAGLPKMKNKAKPDKSLSK